MIREKMIFVDTNAIIALVVEDDQFHQKAVDWLQNNTEKLITSNFIIIETLGWLRYMKGKNIAVETGKNLYSGEGITLERVTLRDEKDAWKLFQKVSKRSISMVDCITSVVMKRLNIKGIFTFDRDFIDFDFTIIPG